MTLRRLPGPFSDPDWLFEIKHDGFRSLAYVQDKAVDLVSRRRYVYKSFAPLRESIASDLQAKNAVLDGEIVFLDECGHTKFNTLLYRRGDARFYAFDLLWLNGEDLRSLPLVDRKRKLRRIIPEGSPCLLYVDHLEGRGEDLFRLACERDLEGIVAKWKRGAYISADERTSWLKIKNREYTQIVGRDKLFEKRTGEDKGVNLSE
jgi:bifunctional non-homologous end joining protein LigD